MRRLPLLGLALALALTSCSALGTHDAVGSPRAAAASPGVTIVSVLGDSHSGWPDSWFRLSVGNASIPGAAGVLASEPGRSSIALQAWVAEATARGGVVLVQAGTNDLLLDHSTPAKAAQGVEALVNAVASRGARAVLVSVPPSATLGPATNQLDALLKDWAAEHNVAWLDVTSAVARPDGTWRPGLSDDGVHANGTGGALMASAARQQLPELLRTGRR
ncbi:hypothetical protein SCMU_29210 [Sinomonas cyclohexanicum]|uniref:SGNH hydrolase-type esterase domain-containing protein n=1 Tax=Sinomonas cyclohexanicum TaxID=322009 RepID=A0ABN6FK98_SINCY|nr:SGNH/GDSL hydrolase family protein [Corynebacterium cyclohexanicum]BCT77079.1 hypothetical protein SCMU_29210 [Corynebacterium cyclohexanicum]